MFIIWGKWLIILKKYLIYWSVPFLIISCSSMIQIYINSHRYWSNKAFNVALIYLLYFLLFIIESPSKLMEFCSMCQCFLTNDIWNEMKNPLNTTKMKWVTVSTLNKFNIAKDCPKKCCTKTVQQRTFKKSTHILSSYDVCHWVFYSWKIN